MGEESDVERNRVDSFHEGAIFFNESGGNLSHFARECA